MRILKNQLIASEGALPYKDKNGKTVFRMKKWDNLKKFIGLEIPIIDEHPEGKMLTGFEKLHGVARIKQCANGNKSLCADMELDDNAPKKKGYSIGFPYDEIVEDGFHLGNSFSSIQDLLGLNHVALTNYPRNHTAVAVTGDDKNGKNTVIKYFFGMDSFRNTEFSSDNDLGDKNKMTENEKELIAKVARLEADLALKATKTQLAADSKKLLAEKDEEIAKVKTESEKYKKAIDSLMEKEKKNIANQAKTDIDSIYVDLPKLNKEFFKGAKPSEVTWVKKAVDAFKTMTIATGTFEEVDSDEDGNYSFKDGDTGVQGNDDDQLTWNPDKEVFE